MPLLLWAVLLAESCKAAWGVCKARPRRAVLEGLHPALCCTSVVGPRADKSQGQSPCGESAYSFLVLIPGRFPSSRKHKPPSSIIHQVLNFIKEPPDTRAGCSSLLPGWESASLSIPRSHCRKHVRFPWPRGGRSFSHRGRFNKDSGVSASLFINKHLLLISSGSLSHCKAKYKTERVFLSSNEVIAPLLFSEASTVAHRMHLQ